jgi:putative YjhG/YagF family dehydratase
VVAEALGLTLPHAALAPSGQPVWRDLAVRSARAIAALAAGGITTGDILTPASVTNAMTVHAAFGGSTNLLIHVPAIAHAAGLPQPSIEEWIDVNRRTPRLVSVLPNGPVHHPTVRVFLAGGVPEVMLHLDRLGLLDTSVRTVSGGTLAEQLAWWETSERRSRFRVILREQDGIDPDDVILPPAAAAARGLRGTMAFLRGSLAPDGAIVKATAIDPKTFSADGVYRHTGPARVFTSERAAIAAIKAGRIAAGDVLVLAGIGPMGTGMEETYQVTSALKQLPIASRVAVVTDARFSGVSTGACIGHVGPEALAGGPLGKLIEGDEIAITIDTRDATGTVELAAHGERRFTPAEAIAELARRPSRPDLAADPRLPGDTRLWALLQEASGGIWAGCVYDEARITACVRRV